MKIAYICHKCGTAHYIVADVEAEGELYICIDKFTCKGKELRKFGKKKTFKTKF
jgi:hypothetical protein